MHRRFHHFHRFFAVAAVLSLFFVVACRDKGDDSGSDPAAVSNDPDAIPTSAPAGTATSAPIVIPVDGQQTPSPAVRQPWPEGQPVSQSRWVQDRLNAVKWIYGFTPEGEEWIDGYDFRQMVEQPAWFGSFGYNSWAGAGEAVPRSVLHEISHSYWGAFSVEDSPLLSWDTSQGTPQALLQYREQLRLFMLQPPDRFEPLRDRFRNLPGLSIGDYPDLAHFGEADFLYMTGGNLQLIPPILKPFYSGFVQAGGAGAEGGITPESWDVALAWFNRLSSEDRRIAGEIFGLQHFPPQRYVDLPRTDLTGLHETVRTLYEDEERQRLIDFEAQFDGIIDREFSLVDAAGADRGFDFWRSYLSDKLALHQRYPQVLREIGSQRGSELAAALDFYLEIGGQSSDRQVERFLAAADQPLVQELAVLLRPRAIVDLFTDPGAGDGIAQVLGSRAERLRALVETVDEVGRVLSEDSSGVHAAFLLEDFIRSQPEDQFRSDAFLLLDLLRSSEQGLAGKVLPELSDDTLQYVLRVQPAFARVFEISPERLLRAVGISDNASLEQVKAGATLLAANSSGNFAIDVAYDLAVFEHLDRFVETAPAEVLDVLLESGMRLVPWLDRSGDGAIKALRAAPEAAGGMLAGLTEVRETPWRIIHIVASVDAVLAAALVLEMYEVLDRSDGAVERAIREFGYDLYWSERNAGPNVEPVRLAEFLLALTEQLSRGQMTVIFQNVVEQFDVDLRNGRVEQSAFEEFKRTLDAAVEPVSDEDADTLRSILAATGQFG